MIEEGPVFQQVCRANLGDLWNLDCWCYLGFILLLLFVVVVSLFAFEGNKIIWYNCSKCKAWLVSEWSNNLIVWQHQLNDFSECYYPL